MIMPKYLCDEATARRRLINRWNEQVEQCLTMREEIPLDLYIAANIEHVRENDLLQSYDRSR